jgi:hypothetical protein
MDKIIPLNKAVLEWTPAYAQSADAGFVTVSEHLKPKEKEGRFSVLSVFSNFSKMNDDQKRLQLMLEMWCAAVRDGIDLEELHSAALAIPEYQEMLPDDFKVYRGGRLPLK